MNLLYMERSAVAKGSGGRLIISSGFKVTDQGGAGIYDSWFGRQTDRFDKVPRNWASPRGVAEKFTRWRWSGGLSEGQ